jgi:CheY-like chemotaxis protein
MGTSKPGQRKAILLVEDDSEVRVYMQRFLQDLGYQVAVATDELDSRRRISEMQASVQLILMNLRMVSDDALAAGRRIREQVNISNSAPVVVLPFEFLKEKEGTDENMGEQDYKSYMTSEEQLEDLLAGLLRFEPKLSAPVSATQL